MKKYFERPELEIVSIDPNEVLTLKGSAESVLDLNGDDVRSSAFGLNRVC